MKGACTASRIGNNNGLCPLCRTPIPSNYFIRPRIVRHASEGSQSAQWASASESADTPDADAADSSAWSYQGRNGWWLFDERTQMQLRQAKRSGQQRLDVQVAGSCYTIDLLEMVQYRRDNPASKRRIRVGTADISDKSIKGVAGVPKLLL